MLKLLTVLSLSLALTLGAESSSGSESSSSGSESSGSSSESSGSSSESSSSESSSGSGSESSSGETTTSTKSNYFVSTLLSLTSSNTTTTLYFAYAVDKCSPSALLSTYYMKPTCVSSSRLDVTYYSDSTCTTSTGVTKSYNSTTSSSLFRCGGTSSYAEVNFGFSASTCLYKFYSALDACTTYGTGSYAALHSSISCSATDAGKLSLYLDSTCGTAYSSVNLNSTCSYKFAISGNNAYASISDCSTASSSATTTSSSSMSTTTASSMSTTTASSMATTTGAGNMIDVRNIFGFLMMVIFAMIFNL